MTATDGPGPAGDPAPDVAVPGTGLMGTVSAIDDRVDRLFEPLRGVPALDAAAKAISAVGDHGWLWTGVAAWRGRRSRRSRMPRRRTPPIRASRVSSTPTGVTSSGSSTAK